MRSYYLKSTMNSTTWSLAPYGASPIFVTSRPITRNPNYSDSSDWTFNKIGESRSVQKFTGKIIFKTDSEMTGEARYRNFMQFVSKNSKGIEYRYLSTSAYYPLIYALELHSVKTADDISSTAESDRFAYVSIGQISGKNNNGTDVEVTITFNLESLWLEKYEQTWTASDTGTTTKSYSFSEIFKNSGDVPATLGFEIDSYMNYFVLKKYNSDYTQRIYLDPSITTYSVNKPLKIRCGNYSNYKFFVCSLTNESITPGTTQVSLDSAYPYLKYTMVSDTDELTIEAGESIIFTGNLYTRAVTSSTTYAKVKFFYYQGYFNE